MRKLKFFLVALLVGFLFLGGGVRLDANADEADKYYVGGMTAGFMLSAEGTEIIGLSEVATGEGLRRPAEDAGLRVGDTIVAADGIRIRSISELNAALERSGGEEITLTVKRRGETTETQVVPAKDKKSGKYKIGVLIRDTLAGIGTVTFIDCKTYRFGALGHDVCDENRNSLGIADSKVFLCSVIGVNRGVRGRAGELRGLFLNDAPLGKAEKVCSTGLYGTFDKKYDFSHCELMEAAPLSEATIGKATIWSTVDGSCPQQYEISIVKVDADNRENKNFVIKVTDSRLIEETGGIVQGMSGSPIVQNGKLIGAVTHVFLNDPTRGYGIGIGNMLGN